MLDLALTDEQELLRSTVRDFVERECPLATVRRIDEQEGGFSRELWQKLAGLGWPGGLRARSRHYDELHCTTFPLGSEGLLLDESRLLADTYGALVKGSDGGAKYS